MADQPGRPTSSTLPLPPELDALFRSVNERLRPVLEIIDRAAGPVEQVTQGFPPFAAVVAGLPRSPIDFLPPIEVAEQIQRVCASLDAMATRMPPIVARPPWSMDARSPEEGRALWDLLIAEWPPDTLISEIARFIKALDRLLTAETDEELAAAARMLARSKAFMLPYFAHKAVRRVLAARARRDGWNAVHAWLIDEVFTPILVDLIRKEEVYRLQRIRLGPMWVKVTGGWYRPTRESAPVLYRPGTIAQVEPMQLPLVQFYRWLRNRTRKFAIEQILTALPRSRTTEHGGDLSKNGVVGDPVSADDAVHVVATHRLMSRERDTATVSAGDVLEAEEVLHQFLGSLTPRQCALVQLRVAGMSYHAIAARLGYPSAVAARVALHRLRATLRTK
jgi:hypothetical protein